MELRYYQREAVESAYKYCQENPGKNPCIVLPTGSGKTHVIAKICEDVSQWHGRVLVVAHVKELLQQAAEKISVINGLDVGIYSAGLKRRDTDSDILIGGIQSIYQKGLELCGSRPFNLVLVDEAHRIPTEGDGMYRRLISDLQSANPKLRVIGLTATPYRTSDGYVCSEGHFLNDVCYEANIKELIAGGFLSKLSSKRSVNEVSMKGVAVSRGDFIESQMEERFNDSEKIRTAVQEIKKYTQDRHKVLVFCCGIFHASNVAFDLEEACGQSVRIVTSEHSDRDGAIKAFRNGDCKYLVNVNCLTEGFDATRVDCVVLLRATLSPGLYYQMVGRGLRTHEGKQDCLVLDFGGNVERHGTIDRLKIKAKTIGGSDGESPVKECPECHEMVHAGLLVCTSCGFEFPQRELNHNATAGSDSVISEVTEEDREVSDVTYHRHEKRNSPESPPTMRVSYWLGTDLIAEEWVCIEHTGFAWEKAFCWWFRRSANPMPNYVDDAVDLASVGALIAPTKIRVRRTTGEKFPRIVGYELGDKPTEQTQKTFSGEEVPF